MSDSINLIFGITCFKEHMWNISHMMVSILGKCRVMGESLAEHIFCCPYLLKRSHIINPCFETSTLIFFLLFDLSALNQNSKHTLNLTLHCLVLFFSSSLSLFSPIILRLLLEMQQFSDGIWLGLRNLHYHYFKCNNIKSS